jgi:translocation and assembly module TamA
VRLLPEARGYYSFGDEEHPFTLAGRVRLGLLFQTHGDDAPIPVRFFSGGNDMRGFSSRRLAPYAVVNPFNCRGQLAIDSLTKGCDQKGDVLPVGGNTLIEWSVELRWNVWRELTIATFVDAGFVRKEGFGLDLFVEMNWAVGIGIRYRTPIGPIRLDLAARLPFGAPLEQYGTNRHDNLVNRGCFLGVAQGHSDVYPGSPESQCAFHLSIGEAF